MKVDQTSTSTPTSVVPHRVVLDQTTKRKVSSTDVETYLCKLDVNQLNQRQNQLQRRTHLLNGKKWLQEHPASVRRWRDEKEGEIVSITMKVRRKNPKFQKVWEVCRNDGDYSHIGAEWRTQKERMPVSKQEIQEIVQRVDTEINNFKWLLPSSRPMLTLGNTVSFCVNKVLCIFCLSFVIWFNTERLPNVYAKPKVKNVGH